MIRPISFVRLLYTLGTTAFVVAAVCLIFSLETYYMFGSGRFSPELTEQPEVREMRSATTSDCGKEHHIAMVLGGYKVVRRASSLFKSILSHHRGPLVFHFITDAQSREVLPTLFETWNLPGVRFNTYDMDKYKSRVDWMPNGHYSAVYGLIKLIIPDILPDDVDEVLMLDSDLVVLGDLSPLFDSFKGTNESALFAMGENISPWYTQGTPKNPRWPARGRGFNSGVVLLNAARMRKQNWNDMWRKETEFRLKTFKSLHLADQDVFNVLAVSNPDMIVELPCEYNFQLGGQSQPVKCQGDARLVKIAHFNSPQKMRLRSKYVVHYAQEYAEYLSMDGNVFRMREDCSAESQAPQPLKDLIEINDNECGTLITAMQTKYRTHLYFNGFSPSTEADDITLVTHLSVDRFDIFDELLRAWEGPVSVSVYCTDAELAQLEEFTAASQLTRGRKNVAMHAVFKTGKYYPANYLRNVALNASRTEFVYLTDVDFIPSSNMYDNLRSSIGSMDSNKTAMVIPAFQIASSKKEDFPKTRDALLEQWEEGKIEPFRPESQSSILASKDYEKWKTANSTIEVEWSNGFEAPILIAKSSTPLNDERFIGFGWSKISYLSRLHDAGFKFEAVPSAFSVHHPHPSSFDTSRFRALNLYRRCMHFIQDVFLRDLSFLQQIQAAAATTAP